MNKNTNMVWVAIVFLAIGLIVGFLITSGTNKTGDAVRGIKSTEYIGENIVINKLADGTQTDVFWNVENADGTTSTKKLSTYTSKSSSTQDFSCELTCTSSGDSICMLQGCDPLAGGFCSSANCGAGCTTSCVGRKVAKATYTAPIK